MGARFEEFKTTWKGIKASSGFHNFLIFLGFVVLATFFWIIMAMNDSAQDTFDVQLNLTGVPDSVTFINDPPKKIHVSVRDKGTRLFRSALNEPKLSINFREYAQGGVFRFSAADMNTSLKSLFGAAAQITNVSVDSLNLSYTTERGKRVPVIISADVKAQSGKVISGRLMPAPTAVRLYSTMIDLDTITRVETKTIVRRNLNETTSVEVNIKPIAGVKIVPSKIKVTIPVEPLVKKTIMVPITIKDLRDGYSLLLFPDNVEVSYFVPMSRFNDNFKGFEVAVFFEDALKSRSTLVPLTITSFPKEISNPTLKSDSVEYTIVK
ncbi:MAG: hypothetical protein HDS70_05445 [Bacteroidales bacterium]|nr:hypothetical protein [Bacteroidales bacterium]